jgi:GTPase
MRKPVVALVGRPNVGKSTLFNRLAGERLAVVDDVPGTTRDRLMAEAEWTGRVFDVVDTGGIDHPIPAPGNPHCRFRLVQQILSNRFRYQAEMAVQEADVVLLITDVHSGVTPADQEVAQILRRLQTIQDGAPYPPVLLVVNKCDDVIHEDLIYQFYELGMDAPYPISSLHGNGTGDLLDALVEIFPAQEAEAEDDTVKIAIVGKPNAGKSTLLNRLIGYERAIVSPIPGTTRDAIDTHLDYEGVPITLIDTAGIRRRGKIEPGVEKYSVVRTMQAIERAEVSLLLIDAETGITSQDAHIAGYILDAWKSTVVIVNKWDAIEKDTHTMQEYTQKIRDDLNFMDYVPILFISAKTGQRVDRVLPLALLVQEERLARISTSQINQVLQNAQDVHPAPSSAGRQLKIYYGTQVRSDPPTFLLYVNDPKLAHFTYLRFLENRLRESYPFTGTPIRIVLKSRR